MPIRSQDWESCAFTSSGAPSAAKFGLLIPDNLFEARISSGVVMIKDESGARRFTPPKFSRLRHRKAADLRWAKAAVKYGPGLCYLAVQDAGSEEPNALFAMSKRADTGRITTTDVLAFLYWLRDSMRVVLTEKQINQTTLPTTFYKYSQKAFVSAGVAWSERSGIGYTDDEILRQVMVQVTKHPRAGIKRALLMEAKKNGRKEE